MTTRDVADDILVVGINTCCYGILGGIGAKINQKRFWDGFKDGALGGVMIGSGKLMVGKNYKLGWPAKFTTCLGTSVATNAVMGRDRFNTLGMDLGPFYLEFQKQDDRYRFNPELWLGSTASLIISAIMADKLDWRSSLQTGSLTFIVNDFGLYAWEEVGMALSNIVWIPDDTKETFVYSHEIIHTYQTTSIAPVGALLLGDGYVVNFYNKLHIRIEEDMGTLVTWVPEILLIPNNKMPREFGADALVDYFPKRPNKRIWEK
jgi:hypothetical protein